jgi:CDP-diacylglycerol--serine O-phosphatidyltransferase
VTEKDKKQKGYIYTAKHFTTFALFAGFYSIVASINGDYTLAAISIMGLLCFGMPLMVELLD